MSWWLEVAWGLRLRRPGGVRPGPGGGTGWWTREAVGLARPT